MAAVTTYIDFGAQENEIWHCFHVFPIYLPWSDRTGCHDRPWFHVCNGIPLNYKKNEIMPFTATWMGPRDYHTKWFRNRKPNTMWYHLYAESKIEHKWMHLWFRSRLTDIKNRLVAAKAGVGRGGMAWESEVSRCKLLLWVDKWQGPPVQHRELYSIFCDKL